MDSQGTDRTDELATGETPEDVAVLYSWANLHGAKYRDFSASRREYRAQLRQRAAQQVREQALLAQAEAEAAATAADSAGHRAVEAAHSHRPGDSDASTQRSLLQAEEAARTAAAERVEAARRAEVAAVAEAAARREEREIAEAHVSAQRQAARYADSEMRRRTAPGSDNRLSEVPGEISDPYVAHPEPAVPFQSQSQLNPQQQSRFHPQSHLQPHYPARPYRSADSVSQQAAAPVQELRSNGVRVSPEPAGYSPVPILPEERVPVQQLSQRRPQGYRPDDASGVRQIYRGPDPDALLIERTAAQPSRKHVPVQGDFQSGVAQEMTQTAEQPIQAQSFSSTVDDTQGPAGPDLRTQEYGSRPKPGLPSSSFAGAAPAEDRIRATAEPVFMVSEPAEDPLRHPISDPLPFSSPAVRQPTQRFAAPVPPVGPRTVSPFSQALVPSDSTRGRRAHDEFDYQQAQGSSDRERRDASEPTSDTPAPRPNAGSAPSASPAYSADAAGPAWLYAPPAPPAQQKPISFQPAEPQSSVADTLQHSRERVAARWFALKGVFEQPGQEQPEAAPVRQKETRTPVLAVFSLAGGVGKTSLVATVGRSLSSMGEKVLLTDTTSHGLLPFYFGASELRQGAVRTFSPPSGSTDAPIYLVSYDVDQTAKDDAAQDLLAEEIINNSRGTHRILFDLTPASSWIVRRMFRMNPTVLVPVAPDMNSVISLQTVEKFFHGINDGDGRPLQPFYVLNQFDTSLPLHLDVREVLRRKLGDRLLPFVIRRAPSVSEALAEGMTVVDYAPDAPVAEDYLNVATWLRTVAAPATAGFRNVRWSER